MSNDATIKINLDTSSALKDLKSFQAEVQSGLTASVQLPPAPSANAPSMPTPALPPATAPTAPPPAALPPTPALPPKPEGKPEEGDEPKPTPKPKPEEDDNRSGLSKVLFSLKESIVKNTKQLKNAAKTTAIDAATTGGFNRASLRAAGAIGGTVLAAGLMARSVANRGLSNAQTLSNLKASAIDSSLFQGLDRSLEFAGSKEGAGAGLIGALRNLREQVLTGSVPESLTGAIARKAGPSQVRPTLQQFGAAGTDQQLLKALFDLTKAAQKSGLPDANRKTSELLSQIFPDAGTINLFKSIKSFDELKQQIDANTGSLKESEAASKILKDSFIKFGNFVDNLNDKALAGLSKLASKDYQQELQQQFNQNILNLTASIKQLANVSKNNNNNSLAITMPLNNNTQPQQNRIPRSQP